MPLSPGSGSAWVSSDGRAVTDWITKDKTMNDREILAACLRWHTAHAHCLEIGAKQRRHQKEQKERTGFGGSDCAISRRLTAAKPLEYDERAAI